MECTCEVSIPEPGMTIERGNGLQCTAAIFHASTVVYAHRRVKQGEGRGRKDDKVEGGDHEQGLEESRDRDGCWCAHFLRLTSVNDHTHCGIRSPLQ